MTLKVLESEQLIVHNNGVLFTTLNNDMLESGTINEGWEIGINPHFISASLRLYTAKDWWAGSLGDSKAATRGRTNDKGGFGNHSPVSGKAVQDA